MMAAESAVKKMESFIFVEQACTTLRFDMQYNSVLGRISFIVNHSDAEEILKCIFWQ